LDRLTPEERVGQLLLITFDGAEVLPDSPIQDLIANHHVGGVILRANSNNFVGPEGTLDAALNFTRELQRTEWTASQSDRTIPESDEIFRPTYIPLFVGTVQEGNGFPHDQILNGMTHLPNSLALGATWQPALANSVGEILGQELAAVGINLLLGPSLDVLESPSPESQGNLGASTFGGDPFWVGEMGQAFITGVHQGSENRIAVVGKHFPGHGGSDRPPEEEVSTVRKTLEQLKLTELAPFFAVTGNAPTPEAAVDALLTSHIRYQGLQGNIRATTSPISFDPQAFESLMSLQPFVAWRENGGVVISDNLGSPAVRGFYDPDGQTFNGRIVALNAFLTGNDMLYLGDFVSSNDLTSTATIIKTLEFFSQKYRDDAAFAERVDLSVLRILSLKYRLYDSFDLSDVLPPTSALAGVGGAEDITFEVARQAATLISPPLSELENILPDPPVLNDRIVFFTDSYSVSQCGECPEQQVLDIEALQNAVTNLYGPETGAQILPYHLVSFSFESLLDVLETGPRDTILEQTLRRADWIVFLMLDNDQDRPASLALRRFLAEQQNLFRNKKLIVFALDAPYFLDATDISKLTAYYGLYSKAPQFIDVAARLLFKELRPIPGALPISLPGIGYDLISVTSPDPSQVIPVFLNPSEEEAESGNTTPEPAQQPDLRLGDLLTVQTGVILDHNGNPVPDDTPVEFALASGGQEIATQIDTTVNGKAEATFIIESTGALTMLARSGEPPAESVPIQLDIPPENIEATETLASLTITAAPSLTTTPTDNPPTSTATPEPEIQVEKEPNLADWALSLLTTSFVGLIAYGVGTYGGQIRWGFRWALCALLGGMLFYTYVTLGLPGTTWLMESAGRFGVILFVLGGAGIGWGVGFLWRELKHRNII
jgi:beta-N-acetylhexosaminidase